MMKSVVAGLLAAATVVVPGIAWAQDGSPRDAMRARMQARVDAQRQGEARAPRDSGQRDSGQRDQGARGGWQAGGGQAGGGQAGGWRGGGDAGARGGWHGGQDRPQRAVDNGGWQRPDRGPAPDRPQRGWQGDPRPGQPNPGGWSNGDRPRGAPDSGGWQRPDGGAAAGGTPAAQPRPGWNRPDRNQDGGGWRPGNRPPQQAWQGGGDGRNDGRWRSDAGWRDDRGWNGRGWNGRGWNGRDGNGRGWDDRRQDGRGWDGRGWDDGGRGNGAWNRDWRRESRYDWNRYRGANRAAFHLPRYYAPYGWNQGYRRFSIGFSLSPVLFARNYWIDDPWSYRLPEVYGPYQWVRYYNDALLVDTYSGEVVDVIYGIFW